MHQTGTVTLSLHCKPCSVFHRSVWQLTKVDRPANYVLVYSPVKQLGEGFSLFGVDVRHEQQGAGTLQPAWVAGCWDLVVGFCSPRPVGQGK